MAKRSVIQSDDLSRIEREFVEIDEIAEELTVSEPERVAIRSLIPARTTWRSPKTGETYLWERSGAEVKVLLADVDFLLSYVRKGCCGAPVTHKFELVK